MASEAGLQVFQGERANQREDLSEDQASFLVGQGGSFQAGAAFLGVRAFRGDPVGVFQGQTAADAFPWALEEHREARGLEEPPEVLVPAVLWAVPL